MRGIDLTQMMAFVAIAERQSFTKAAAQLDSSPSSLSQTMRALEEKLGVRLLNRTTRSVSLTEAGEALLRRLKPLLEDWNSVVDSVAEHGPSPSGQLRLTVADTPGRLVVAPLLDRFITTHPAINVEISVDNSAVDIVKERFDAGIRISSLVERDMIAVRVTEYLPIVVVASPEYLMRRPSPKKPRDLSSHNCIRWRLPDGSLTHCRFEKRGKRIRFTPTGSLIVNDANLLRMAALGGQGVGYILRHHVEPHITEGSLVELLADWTPRAINFSLYYPSRRRLPPPLKAFLEFIGKASPRTAANPPQKAGARHALAHEPK